MKKLYLIFILSLLFFVLNSETHIPSGSINGTWNYINQPYIIDGNISLLQNEELIIESGVQIEFSGHYSFTVYGRLTAEGSVNDSIVFTAQDTETGWYGLRFLDTSNNGQDLSIINYCVFENGNGLTGNEDSNRGGALYCLNSSDVHILNSRFANNKADYGGALAISGSDIFMQNCLLEYNFGSHDAGAMFVRDASEPILDNLTFSNNMCNYDGGAMFISSGSAPTISNSRFYYNKARDYYDGSGGGISCWGSTLFLNDSEFKYNSAKQDGGAIEIAYDSSAELENIVVTHNNSGGAAGIDIYSSFVSLAGVDVCFNISNYGTGGIDFGYNSSVEFSAENLCNIYLNNSLNGYNVGNDLTTGQSNFIEVIVDTFTVINPTSTQAEPLSSFLFDILNGRIEPVSADLYVSPNGSDANSGLTLDDPLQTIFTALLMIEPSGTDPLTIHLSDGVYSPSNNNETFPLEMKDYITISGTSREQTILDAEQINNLIYSFQRDEINIENLSLINGFDNQENGGGAIYCYETEININNILVDNNFSRNSGGGIMFEYCLSPQLSNVNISNNESWGFTGGGMYCRSSNPNLQNVTIKDNLCYGSGGGLGLEDSTPVFDPAVTCNIYSNRSFYYGGKDIYTDSYGSVNVIVDTFTVMQPDDYFATPIENFTFSISNTIIQQVDSDLYVSPSGSDANSGLSQSEPLKTIDLAMSKIISNETNPNTIHLSNGTYSSSSNEEKLPIQAKDHITLSGADRETTIIDAESNSCILIANWINGIDVNNLTLTNGRAVYDILTPYGNNQGGGAYISMSENITFSNVIVSNNIAGKGAGLSCYDSIVRISNALFSNNHTQSSYGGSRGGAIYCTGYSIDEVALTISNSTFCNNSAEASGGAIYLRYTNAVMLNTICWGNAPQEIYLSGWNEENEFIIANSDLSNGQLSIINENYGTVNWLEGNISSDPLFLDPNINNYYLQNGSPCIDAGIDFFEWEGEIYLDLSPDDYYGLAPDMGTYEWDGTQQNEELIMCNYELANYPNPFNPVTNISFSIPEDSKVELSIYNVKGQKVRTLVNNKIDKGIYQITWNSKDDSGKTAASGIYFYKLKTSKKEIMKKMLLLK